jgi:DNA primase
MKDDFGWWGNGQWDDESGPKQKILLHCHTAHCPIDGDGALPPVLSRRPKSQIDIVSVIGDIVPLKKPAHVEGTVRFAGRRPRSMSIGTRGSSNASAAASADRQLRRAAAESGVSRSRPISASCQDADSSRREEPTARGRRWRGTLVKLHEQAAAFVRQLLAPAGARARREIESRGLSPDTRKTFGYGYAPAAGRETLHALFSQQKVPVALQLKSGLVVDRDGRLGDRFRNRLMIPIARDSGPIVAFGGRALDGGQVPKYLNSPETPVYTKGRTLYGLSVAKEAIRKHNYCVLVEGYFDLAQVWQAGVHPVVASSGTALTSAQARTLKRFTSKVVLSFDPDAAGQGRPRARRALVRKAFVNVVRCPTTPIDMFIRRTAAGVK